MVLVLNIKLLEHPELVMVEAAWATPRLRSLDDCPHAPIPDSSDLVAITAAVSWRQSKVGDPIDNDRVLDPHRPVARTGARIHDVIQSGTKVVDRVSDQQRPALNIRHRGEFRELPKDRRLEFRLLRCGDRWAALFGPPRDLLVEGPEVFFRPLDFRQGSCEGFDHA